MWDLNFARKQKKLGYRFVSLGVQKIDDIKYMIINDTVTSVCYIQTSSEKIHAVGVSLIPMYNSDGTLYTVDL
jgi:hypothetical protein